MVKAIFDVISFIFELLSLVLISACFYRLQIKITMCRITAVMASVIGVFSFSLITGLVETSIITVGVSVLCAFVMLERKKNYLKFISALLLLIIIEMLLFTFGVALRLITFENIDYTKINIIIRAIILAIVTIAVVATKKNMTKTSFHDYSKQEILLLIAGQTTIAIMLWVMILLCRNNLKWNGIGMSLVIFCLCSIILVAISFFLSSVKYKNRYIKMEQSLTTELLTSQEKYYTMLLKKEEQTKAFRHDFRNHILCIKSLCEKGEYLNVSKYLEDLEQTANIYSINIHSGNKLIDIIISDLQSGFPDVKFSIFGTIDSLHNISQMDLCTIFSNLITNAFEAAEKSEFKTVKMHIKRLNSNLYVEIINSVEMPPVISEDGIRSSKKSGEHGYGISNAKNCLSAYGGELQLSVRDNNFVAGFIIPGVITIDTQ